MIANITRYLLNILKTAYNSVHALVFLLSTHFINQSKSIFFSLIHILRACVEALWDTLYLALALLIQKVVRYTTLLKQTFFRIIDALFLIAHHLINFFLYHPLSALTSFIKTLTVGAQYLYATALPNTFAQLFTTLCKCSDYIKNFFSFFLNELISFPIILWIGTKQLIYLSGYGLYKFLVILQKGTLTLFYWLYSATVKIPLSILSNTTTYIAQCAALFYKKSTTFFIGPIIKVALGISNICNSFIDTTSSVALELKSILKTSTTYVINIFNNIIDCFNETKTRLSLLQSATRNALAGTAGFMFISIPRGFKNYVQATLSWLFFTISEILSLWFIDTPKALWSSIVSSFSGLKKIVTQTGTYLFCLSLNSFSFVKNSLTWCKDTCTHGLQTACSLIANGTKIIIKSILFLPSHLYSVINSGLQQLRSTLLAHLSFDFAKTKISTFKTVTKTALSGTAGFMFISVPREFKNYVQATLSWLFLTISEILSLWFIDTPKALWSAFMHSITILYNLCIQATTHITSFNLNLFSNIKSNLIWFKDTSIKRTNTLFNYGTTSIILITKSILFVPSRLFSAIGKGLSWLYSLVNWNATKEKLSDCNIVAKTTLSGTAGFIFISVPRGFKNSILSTLYWLFLTTSEIFSLWFIDTPKALWTGFSYGMHTLQTFASYALTKTISFMDGTFSLATKVIQNTFSFSWTCFRWLKDLVIKNTVMTYKLLSSGIFFTTRHMSTLGFVALSTTRSSLSWSTNFLIRCQLGTISALTIATQHLLNAFYFLSKSLFNTIASTINILFRAVKASGYGVFLGLKYTASLFIKALQLPFKRVHLASDALHTLFERIKKSIKYIYPALSSAAQAVKSHTITFINNQKEHVNQKASSLQAYTHYQKLVIQEYAFIGTVLYVALVLLTTFITPFQKETMYSLFESPKAAEIVHYNRTLPVRVSFELQSMTQPTTSLGDVTVKGILSYNYETGLEAARHIDNITIEKVQSYSLKKLGSHMDRRHGITTQFLLTAALKTTASNAASFPFAPTESSFVLKNNTLTTKEIYYEPAGTSVALKNENSRLSKINMRPAGQHSNSPKLTVTFEHTGLSPLVILGLYALIILSALASIATLALLPQAIGVRVSGISTLVLGSCWVGSYLFGMFPAINHLMLTLLLCFALSILCFGLNAKHIHNLEAGQPAGRTRWTICLLAILAAFLTAFIGL